MPNFKLIVSTSLPEDLEYQLLGCADVSHDGIEVDCAKPKEEKFLIFDQEGGTGMFVHAGCESIKLTDRAPLEYPSIAMLKGVATGLSMRYKPDDDGPMRFVESTMEEIQEYRRMEKLVALGGSFPSMPPPPPRGSVKPTTTSSPIVLKSKEDIQKMDDFLSGSKYAQYGRNYKSISERNTPPDILERQLKAPELPSSREFKDRKLEARKATQASSASSALATQPKPIGQPKYNNKRWSEMTTNLFLKTIDIDSRPEHLRLIVLNDFPSLKTNLEYIPCADMSHDECVDGCSHPDLCILVNTRRWTGIKIHNGAKGGVNLPCIPLIGRWWDEVDATSSSEEQADKRTKAVSKPEGMVAKQAGPRVATMETWRQVEATAGKNMSTSNEKQKTTLPIPIRTKAAVAFPTRQPSGSSNEGNGFLPPPTAAKIATHATIAKLQASSTPYNTATGLHPSVDASSQQPTSKSNRRSKATVPLVGWEQQGAKNSDAATPEWLKGVDLANTPFGIALREARRKSALSEQPQENKDRDNSVKANPGVKANLESTTNKQSQENAVSTVNPLAAAGNKTECMQKTNDSLKTMPGVKVNHEGGKDAEIKPTKAEVKAKAKKRVAPTPVSSSEPRAAAPGVSLVVVKDEADDWEAVNKEDAEDDEYVFI